jgi:hypothetical protein
MRQVPSPKASILSPDGSLTVFILQDYRAAFLSTDPALPK